MNQRTVFPHFDPVPKDVFWYSPASVATSLLFNRSASVNVVEFGNPPDSKTFRRAYIDGKHFPVQACQYVEHRARLYIMKALVDYWLAKQRGEIADRMKNILKIGGKVVAQRQIGISNAMEKALPKLSVAKFQTVSRVLADLLWSWGGFLLTDNLAEEYAQPAKETGVPTDEIPIALSAFDEIFPIAHGWFRDTDERGPSGSAASRIAR